MTLLAVGKLKESFVREGVAFYLDRLRHRLTFEVVELPASREKDALAQCADETKRLVHALQQRRGQIWVLDETGTQMSSAALARTVAQAWDRGEQMIFVLGGAYGMDLAQFPWPHHILSLSTMTLPHDLCRLVFLEQCYRAQEINRGSGYHHG